MQNILSSQKTEEGRVIMRFSKGNGMGRLFGKKILFA